jgi:hypothetical protein
VGRRGGEGVEVRIPMSFQGDQTTRPYRCRGSRERRGQGRAHRVVGQV